MSTPVWVFLRHGECVGNVERRLVAPDDSPLTARGWVQAHEAAARVAAMGVSQVLVSPTLRTRQTADAIRAVCPTARYTVLEDLRERSFGRLDGWTAEAVKGSEWASVRAAWLVAAPGGETLAAVAGRAIQAIVQCASAERTVVVTHAGVIRAVVGLLDGMPTAKLGQRRVPHAEPWVRAVPDTTWARLLG